MQNILIVLGIIAGVILGILSNWIYDILKNGGHLPDRPNLKRFIIVISAFVPIIFFVALPTLMNENDADLGNVEQNQIVEGQSIAVGGDSESSTIIQVGQGEVNVLPASEVPLTEELKGPTIEPANENELLVLVADFDGPNPENYRITETILSRLRTAIEGYDDIRIEALNKTITEAEGSDMARELGNLHKAGIVIWGWYGVTRDVVPLSVNFELLLPTELDSYYHLEIEPDVKGNIQTPKIETLETFNLQTDLSDEMTYFSLYTLGIIRYFKDDYEGAIASFKNAFDHAPEPVSPEQQSKVYRGIGDAYNDNGEHELIKPK